MTTLENNHIFPRESHRKLGASNRVIRIEIINDNEIKEIVLTAKTNLTKDIEKLGISNVKDSWWKNIHISFFDTEFEDPDDVENDEELSEIVAESVR